MQLHKNNGNLTNTFFSLEWEKKRYYQKNSFNIRYYNYTIWAIERMTCK